MRYALIFAGLLFVACASSSQLPPPEEVPTPAGSVGEIEQQIYNTWLDTTREFVADDPALACEDDTRNELAGTVVGTGQNPTLFKLAFLDACKEVGRIPYPGDFSPYHANAP